MKKKTGKEEEELKWELTGGVKAMALLLCDFRAVFVSGKGTFACLDRRKNDQGYRYS